MISAIVCVDKNFGIGYNKNLLVKIPDDMKYFKKLTTGRTVIMGRATYDSLPAKPLKDRKNIIITHDINSMKYGERNEFPMNMESVKQMLNNSTQDEIFIIGGGQIYEELLPYCNRVYLTKINSEYKADTYFPNIDNISEWKLTSKSELKEYDKKQYQFLIYDKVDDNDRNQNL